MYPLRIHCHCICFTFIGIQINDPDMFPKNIVSRSTILELEIGYCFPPSINDLQCMRLPVSITSRNRSTESFFSITIPLN